MSFMSFSITRDLINFLRYYILNIIKKNNNIIINSKMSEPSSKKLKVNNNNTTQKEQIKYVLEEINLIPKNQETNKSSNFVKKTYIKNYSDNDFISLLEEKNRKENLLKLKEKINQKNLSHKDCDYIEIFNNSGFISSIDTFFKDSNPVNEGFKEKVITLNNVCDYWRKIKGDGNCFYRAVIFAYIENLIFSNNLSRLKDLICDMNVQFKNDVLNKLLIQHKISANKIISCMMLIYFALNYKMNINDFHIINAYQIFIKLFNNYRDFDYGLIFYFRFILYKYIKSNEDNCYTEDFPVMIGNLLPAEYETEDDMFLFQKFYDEFLLKLYKNAEKIVIYLTPYVLEINLNILMFEVSNKTLTNLQFNSIEKNKDNKYNKISILYKSDHFDISYNKEFFNTNFNYLYLFYDGNDDTNELDLDFISDNKTIDNSLYYSDDSETININDINNTSNDESTKIESTLRGEEDFLQKINLENRKSFNQSILKNFNKSILFNKRNSLLKSTIKNGKVDNKDEAIRFFVINFPQRKYKRRPLSLNIRKVIKIYNKIDEKEMKKKIKKFKNKKNELQKKNNKVLFPFIKPEKKIIYHCNLCNKPITNTSDNTYNLCNECFKKKIMELMIMFYQDFKKIKKKQSFKNFIEFKPMKINGIENNFSKTIYYYNQNVNNKLSLNSIVEEIKNNICANCFKSLSTNKKKLPCNCTFCNEKCLRMFLTKKVNYTYKQDKKGINEYICLCGSEYNLEQIDSLICIFNNMNIDNNNLLHEINKLLLYKRSLLCVYCMKKITKFLCKEYYKLELNDSSNNPMAFEHKICSICFKKNTPSKKSNISCMICKKPHELKGFDKNYI